MYNNDTRSKLKNIVNWIIIERTTDNCTAIRNILCGSFSTSTTVKKEFESKAITKKEQAETLTCNQFLKQIWQTIMRKVQGSNLCRCYPPSVFGTAPLPSLATFHREHERNRTVVKIHLQCIPFTSIRYMLISGGQWNWTITAVTRNILAGCRNKPLFAYPPVVGDIGFEPIVFLMYRIYSPALRRHRSRSPDI